MTEETLINKSLVKVVSLWISQLFKDRTAKLSPLKYTACNGLHMTGPFIHSPHLHCNSEAGKCYIRFLLTSAKATYQYFSLSLNNGVVRNISPPGFKSQLTSIDSPHALNKWQFAGLIHNQRASVWLTKPEMFVFVLRFYWGKGSLAAFKQRVGKGGIDSVCH